MNNINYQLFLKMMITVCIMSGQVAYADIYIDRSNNEHFRISNKYSTQDYKFKNIEAYKLEIPIKRKTTINLKKLPFDKEVLSVAEETNIAPALIHAIMRVESNHNSQAQSKKGAYGLMQLMPDTARRFKVRNKNDPKQNILAGAQYLGELLHLFNGDLNLALAAYNAGPRAIQKHYGIPPYKETMEYVPKVMKYYQQYSLQT